MIKPGRSYCRFDLSGSPKILISKKLKEYQELFDDHFHAAGNSKSGMREKCI